MYPRTDMQRLGGKNMTKHRISKRWAWLLLGAAGTAMAIGPGSDSALPPLPDTAILTLPALDVAKASAEDAADKRIGAPRRFGLVAELKGSTLEAGRWTELADGDWLWQLAVSAPNAKAVDFSFRRFHLPHGAELSIRSVDGKDAIGPFSDRDNRPHGQFYTPLLAGDAALLELRVPKAGRQDLRLELAGVTRAYRGAFGDLPGDGAAPKSGSCNLDVVCPQGDPWRPQIASVAHYSFQRSFSTFVCTGQLTADASRANTRIFTTANHCVDSDTQARSMVFYWGYENATCRAVGSAASGTRIPLAGNFRATQSGARLLASHVDSDFTVVELEVDVPAAAQAVATGWDRRTSVPANTFTVHHPQGHEKRISFDNNPPLRQDGPVQGITGRLYWHILAWDLGTTEGGSSGSGLWDPNGRLIGVLSGGEASCANNVNDFYGRLDGAWDGGGSPATRARDWLDPFATGAQFTDGGGVSLGAVTLSSNAFSAPPAAGEIIVFEVSASGGTPPYTYQWDLDGDGQIDRSSSTPRIEASFPRAATVQVMVRATDTGGRSGMDSRSLSVRGPRLQVEAVGAPVQACGNGNPSIDPGERWRQTVRLTNTGNAPQPAANALFAATSGSLPIGPSPSGYTATTSSSGGCGFGWIDLVSGANATTALPTSVGNGNQFGPLDDARTPVIALGGAGFNLYGQGFSQAVMSTNGYLAFNAAETGADFSPACSADYNSGAVGPQLRPYHDDLVVLGSGSLPASGGGLRYRYFATCPRPAEVGGAQGCHVFSWTRMQRWNANSPTGDFDFQAIAYEASGQIAYQFRTASPDLGAGATIGIANASGSEAFNVSCQSGTPAQAGSAACVFAPGAQPAINSVARLSGAVPAVPALAQGASATVELTFAVPSNAQCGASLAFDHIATATQSTQRFERQRAFDGSVAANCVASSCPGFTPPPSTPPPGYRPGLYFNPQRPGNGVLNFLYTTAETERTLFGGAWYTALPDRTPVWYTLQGDLFNYAGTLPIRRFSNPAAPGGFAPVSEQVGRAWVGLIGGTGLLLAWELDDGRSGAERMDPTPLAFGNPNHSQTWFNPAEAGWGLAIESLATPGGLEFFGAFLYDALGAPRWAVGDVAGFNGGTVNLTGHRPHCAACPWIVDWASDGRPAGSLQIGYGNRTSATLNTAISLPAPYAGNWNRTALPIVPIAEPQP